MYYEYFPETFIQLQLEIGHHPLLLQRLTKHSQSDVGVIFAEVCHYCGYAINTTLDGEQLEALAEILLEKLKGMAIKEAIKDVSNGDWKQEAHKFGVH